MVRWKRKKSEKPRQKPPKEQNSKEMDMLQHFEEIRKRVLLSLVALALTTFVGFYFGQELIEIIARPVGGIDVLVSLEVTENIGVVMRVSLLGGFILAFPFILYQVLAFITPGLRPNERRWVFLSIPLATVLFAAGVLFAYYVMLPAALPFLINFFGIRTTPRLSNYFTFVTSLMFWIGVSFETPLLVFVLAKLKIVTARMLIKQWRLAIVIIAVLAAVVTPTPDPVNMALLMLPLAVLYILSILLAALAAK